MADIVRYAGQGFIDCSRRWINGQHEKVLSAIMRCRTASLGGHRDPCSGCGHTAISYNSCRNRHCPRCQANARLRWLQAREQELLPTRYVHLVFTLPSELAPLALQNKRVIYNLWHQQNHLNYHPQLPQDHGCPHSPQSRPTHAVRNTTSTIHTTRSSPIENT